MRAYTITTISRSVRRAVALALGVCALTIPASATASTGYSSVSAISGPGESSQPVGGGDYSSVTSLAPPVSKSSSPSGSESVDSGYSSVSAISGPPADAPTPVSGSTGSGEGFDWPSALVGAGAGLALAAFGGAALLTLRRRTAISPSASTS